MVEPVVVTTEHRVSRSLQLPEIGEPIVSDREQIDLRAPGDLVGRSAIDVLWAEQDVPVLVDELAIFVFSEVLVEHRAKTPNCTAHGICRMSDRHRDCRAEVALEVLCVLEDELSAVGPLQHLSHDLSIVGVGRHDDDRAKWILAEESVEDVETMAHVLVCAIGRGWELQVQNDDIGPSSLSFGEGVVAGARSRDLILRLFQPANIVGGARVMVLDDEHGRRHGIAHGSLSGLAGSSR